MRSSTLLAILVGLFLLGGCCLPMQLLHNYLPGHPAHTAAQRGAVDPNAPQEYVMQEQPPVAPGQPSPPATK